MSRSSLTMRVALLVVCGTTLSTAGQDSPYATKLGRMESEEISESSGLALASMKPDAFWTHNDSGGKANLYLVSFQGETLGQYELHEIKNTDWEDMSTLMIESQRWLLVADVGDNARKRTSCQLHVFAEPKSIKPGRQPEKIRQVTTVDFRYEDGPRDCESVACDPSGNVLLVEKTGLRDGRFVPATVHLLSLNLKNARQTHIANKIASVPIPNATAAEISPNGRLLIIRNYFIAYLYKRAENASWQETLTNTSPLLVPLPIQPQGESICFTSDSNSLILTSERKRQPIWKVPLQEHITKEQQ